MFYALITVPPGRGRRGRRARRFPQHVHRSFRSSGLVARGADSKAESLLQELAKRRTADTILQTMDLPMARGMGELHRGQPEQAIRTLESARPYGWGWLGEFGVLYTRGEAYLKAGKGHEAAEQFERMLKLRMIWPLDPLLTLAHLGLGRVYAAAGNVDQGRTAYQDFFALTKDADPDIPGCGLHAFRHTNSSLMDRLGTPLKVRQQRLGHSDPRLTLGVYTHVAGEDDARIAAQLGQILHPIAPKSKEEGLARFEQALVN